MKKKLFISYSKDNHEVVDRFMKHLRIENGNHDELLDVFLDKDRLIAGFEWRPMLVEQLSRACGYVFFVSVDSLDSAFIKSDELPAMAYEFKFNACPIYLFMVSKCGYADYEIQIEGSDHSLKLGELEVVGPKQSNGRWDWFDQLSPEQTESALSQAAKIICEGMQAINIQKQDENEAVMQNQQVIKPSNSVKMIAKPRVDNLIAHLDRNQISDSLKAELDNHVVVAVATNVIEKDWVEGVALRFGYEKLAVKSGRTTDPIRLDIEWPLISGSEAVREKTLWMNIFDQYGISAANDIERAFEALWVELNKRIHKKIRIVIHYRIRNSKSDSGKDKSLALSLAKRWKSFIDMLENPMQGRIILLFSINQDAEPPQGFFSMFSKKAINLDSLIECLQRELPVENLTDAESGGCCIIDGGQLAKIIDSDTERWKKKVQEADITASQSEAILLAVEENIPEGGIRHRTLMKKIKMQEVVRELFKVT